ncbi:site-specific integrase [Streptomyces sp. PSKA30]|uniref:tyrosine-type recombinase/integrase n=1 Tax=Streptomyces sp. PSKA30 TaxID=2874597 RepID=UPI001CD079E1|nr:site-specific integrase [Streptomyces sp. PSKA30]MBZ9640487.1 site-specific integrase [Streptomyces sp. PSKA30]
MIRSFYEFWIESGSGPLVNPVPLARNVRRRPHAHHNPLDPYGSEGRLRYNPKVPRRRPRQLPDERWNEPFAALRSNRDRAILALGISNAARASELLGVRGVDIDWGDQLVRVERKGSQAEQWLPSSPESFIWLRLCQSEGPPLDPQAPLWWTLRRRDHGEGLAYQPMNFEALSAVFRQVNALLGTNWSMHDLRHTAALRMARDKRLTLRDVQTILGHAHNRRHLPGRGRRAGHRPSPGVSGRPRGARKASCAPNRRRLGLRGERPGGPGQRAVAPATRP